MELHTRAKIVGRGKKNRTACGSSAYRSCSKIYDNDGRLHDYRRKGGYVMGGVELPAGAPEELRDRQTLWGRHEAKDVRKDAQLYRDLEFSFPNDLSYLACSKISVELAQDLTDLGMCVQWDLHDTTKRGKRNLHAHFMVTMRELLPDGTFGNKNRSWNRYNGGLNIEDMLRPKAARLMNEELARIGSQERVEHESFAARGIDRLPTLHVGVAGTAIDRKGGSSYRKKMNDVVRDLNAEHMTYLERLEKLRDARADLAANFASSEKRSLFDQIDAGDAIRRTTVDEQKVRISEEYARIKECNAQIYDLRKEKKETDKFRKALYTYHHLAGDSNLDADQKEQLAWATGYIRWATGTAPTSERVAELIETVRERNTQRCVDLAAAEARKRRAIGSVAAARENVREIKHEEWLRSRGIYR